MERDRGEIQLRDQDGNFNSHAHVERDFLAKSHINHAFISTHTLTWSVTAMRRKVLTYAEISTHTLTWSVTA